MEPPVQMTLPWGHMSNCGCSSLLYSDNSGTLVGKWIICVEHSLKTQSYDELRKMLALLFTLPM